MSSSPSAGHTTPVPERDAQLLSIGKQCSHPSCQLIDFLPFKCQHCAESFCQEHFMVTAHSCPKYDETKYNRVAPNCPLCNEPVAIRVGQDPNNRMEEHFAKECSVTLGRAVKKSSPVCARGKCGKVLFAPIRCDKCQKEFCPSHRFPGDHSCNPTPAAASNQARSGSIPVSSHLLNFNAKNLETKALATSSATVGAIKKTLATASTSASSSSSSSKPSTFNSHSNPFSKTDRSSPAEPTLLSNTANPSDATTTETTVPPTSTTSYVTPTTVPSKLKSKPEPMVRSTSFVPRPIFASA